MSESKLRENICQFATSLFERGITHGSTGNISVRLNDYEILVTPSGSSFGRLDPNEIVKISDFEQPAPVPRKIDETKDDIDNDYINSRDNYYNLIDKGNQAIEGILDIAKEGQHPRAYEVAGNLIKQVADTVDKLQDLQGKLKTLKDVPNKTTANIKQALFVGSSADLHKMLKNKNKDVQSDEDKSFEGKVITPTETDVSDKWTKVY